MSEKLIGEEEFQRYKLEIYWGRPPEFAGHSRDICTICVKSDTEEGIIFTEQTHISLIAVIESKNLIRNLYPELLRDKLTEDNVIGNFVVNYTIKKVKDRIQSGNFKMGELYKEEIMTGTTDIESWVHNVRQLFDEGNE